MGVTHNWGITGQFKDLQFLERDLCDVASGLTRQITTKICKVIKTYISEHIGDDLSVAFLSGLLRMSSAYFCKAFSRSFGVTPHRFILNERGTIARQRLQNASAPSLAVLANGLGFANQAHFSNVFRKHVGCSPSAYRRKVG